MPKDQQEQEVVETKDEETTETATDSKEDQVEETKQADAKEDTEETTDKEEEKQDEVDNALATENAELKQQVETLTAQVTEYAELKENHAVVTERVKTLEAILDEVVAEGLKEIPENIKTLMPDNADAVGKLEWIKKAKKSGLVANTKQVGGVEIGKPMNVETAKVDTSKMSAGDLMRMAFSTVRK